MTVSIGDEKLVHTLGQTSLIDQQISLFAGVDLGLLAAGITLLAIYPAIGLILAEKLHSADAKFVINYNKRRRKILITLAVGITAAWLALIIILIASSAPAYQNILAPIISLLTGVSLLSMGASGYLIFFAAADHI